MLVLPRTGPLDHGEARTAVRRDEEQEDRVAVGHLAQGDAGVLAGAQHGVGDGLTHIVVARVAGRRCFLPAAVPRDEPREHEADEHGEEPGPGLAVEVGEPRHDAAPACRVVERDERQGDEHRVAHGGETVDRPETQLAEARAGHRLVEAQSSHDDDEVRDEHRERDEGDDDGERSRRHEKCQREH